MRNEPSSTWTDRITSFLGDPWPTRTPKLMSSYVRELAIRGVGKPDELSQREVQDLSRSIIDHIHTQKHI